MQQKTSFFTILLGVLLVIVVINILVVTTLVKKGAASGYSLSFTQPVYSFSGTVTTVAKNSMIVEFTPASMPTSKTAVKNIDFKVLVNEKTAISSTPVMIPYVFKNNLASESSAKKTLADITPGSMVTVTSAKDLRTLENSDVQATAISVQPLLQVIVGKIVSTQGSNVVVKGTKMVSGAIQPTTTTVGDASYTVTTDSGTEIAKMPGVQLNPVEPAKPEKLTAGALKANDTVTVYGYPGQSESGLNALMIRVEQALLLEAPKKSASQSATPVSSVSATIAPPKMEL